MDKRVAVEIPQAMYRLLMRYADIHGFDTDAYVAQVLHKHIEDLHDIAAVEAHLEEVRNGNSKTYTMEQLERELGLDD
jgi:RHH-type transcriptional regulator, rel operon repressor / antitoxin RelB